MYDSNLTLGENINIVDKLLKEYCINGFQYCDIPSKHLNETFGMKKGVYRSCEYGVQSVHLLGGKYPSIRVDYNTNWKNEVVVKVNETRSPLDKTKWRSATYYEIQDIFNFWYSLINKRKNEIESANENPSLEVFANKCLESINTYIGNAYDGIYYADLTFGKACKDRSPYTAIVLYSSKEKSPYTQLGYIMMGQNKFKEYGLTCRVCGVEYSYDLNSFKEFGTFEKSLKRMIDFIVG